MLSRQEELKERARVLLEQARRDAALKAGNKQLSSALIPARTKQLNDVRNTGHSCSLTELKCILCVLWWGGMSLQSVSSPVWCVVCPSFAFRTCFSCCGGKQKGASHFPGSGSVSAPSLIGAAGSGGMKLKHFSLNDSEVICAVSDCFSFS